MIEVLITPEVPLPDLPSDLQQMALDDTLAIEKDPAYQVEMGIFHGRVAGNSPTCSACMAGAVMRCQLGAAPDQKLAPNDYDADTEAKLSAIDYLRSGEFDEGFSRLGIAIGRVPVGLRKPTSYHACREQFIEDVEHNIAVLREAGL